MTADPLAAAAFPGMGEARFADTARVLLATPEGRDALATGILRAVPVD